MTLDHCEVLEALAKQLQPKLYVELGVYRGECISRVRKHCARVIGVDTAFELTPDYESYQMPTQEFCASVLPGLPLVDMAFIDADHNALSAMADFKAILRHSAPGAVIALHDTYPADAAQLAPGFCGDSWKVPKKIRDEYPALEVWTLPVPPGLTLVRNAPAGWVRWMQE